MIIKNNYNNKNVDPLNDYTSIGKGSHTLDSELEKQKKGFIKDNMRDPILQKLRNGECEIEDDSKEDKWDFFR